jgi:hypothetical protein
VAHLSLLPLLTLYLSHCMCICMCMCVYVYGRLVGGRGNHEAAHTGHMQILSKVFWD